MAKYSLCVHGCVSILTMPEVTRNPRYSSLNNRPRQQGDFKYIAAYYTIQQTKLQPHVVVEVIISEVATS